jgi:chromosome partitioning protein
LQYCKSAFIILQHVTTEDAIVKIVSVISPKGGVGKTTTALSLCQSSAAAGLRTLLVDFDNQANATASLVPLDDTLSRDNAYDLVSKEQAITPMVVSPKLSLVPAANSLTQLDREDFDIFFRLRERLHSQFAESFDLVVIDTPGNLGTRMTAAVVAAHAIYVPIELTQYSLQALGPMMELYKRVQNRFNPELQFLGFLANRVAGISVGEGLPTVTAEREVYEALQQQFGASGLLGLIAQRRGIKDTMSTGGTVQDIHADQSGRRAQDELTAFATTLLQRIGLQKAA